MVDKSTSTWYTFNHVEKSTNFAGSDEVIDRFEQFTAAVFAINRCVQKIERIEMGKFGLKGPHAQCLLAMSHYPDGITVTQLRDICDKDKAAISRTVADLERAGMVERLCHNGNRYRAMLMLTVQGRAAAEQVTKRAGFAVEKAGNGLTGQQRDTMYAALEQIAENLQMICADGLEEDEFKLNEDQL